MRISEARDAADIGADGPEGPEGLDGLDIELRAGGHEPAHLDGADLIVVSPGVPEHAPVIAWALDRDVPVWSELELGAQLIGDTPFVAITGTNGKTTTTELVASSLQASGHRTVACGNIGYPFSLAAREGWDVLAVEASSFQLRFTESFHPRISVLLNIAEDHLDWHGSFERYADAKARIFANQGTGDAHIGNAEDARAAAISRTAPCSVFWFGLGEPAEGAVGYIGQELVSRTDASGEGVRLGVPRSAHAGFRADAAAAAAASLRFGVAPEAVVQGLAAVGPLAHRGEIVATVGEIAFIDDSKATNPHATLAALQGTTDVVLIAGGRSKGVDLTPLGSAAPHLTAVVAIGEAASEIEDLFSQIVPVRRAESIEQAVSAALASALPHGKVILAPGCASQDMFEDYRERGTRFAEAARALPGARAPSPQRGNE